MYNRGNALVLLNKIIITTLQKLIIFEQDTLNQMHYSSLNIKLLFEEFL